MTTLLGIDVSHYQGRPNLAAFKAAGGAFVIAKATEGVGFVDSEHDITRADAAAAGLVFGSYHFAKWGDPVAEARYFLQHAAPRAGELVALDAESAIPAGVDVGAWADTWSRAVKVALGVAPLIYMNGSWLAGHDWSAVLGDNDGLWLAKYDGPQPSPGGIWPALSFKQFTSTGTEPGVSGPVDVDEFYGDLTALMKYTVPAATPAPAPAPVPAPVPGGTMTLTQPDVDAVWWNEKVTRNDASTGGVAAQVPVIQELADAKSYAYQALTAVRALAAVPPAPFTLDAAGAALVAAALAADPAFAAAFKAAVDAAAATVVAGIDADLAKRFGTP